MMDISGKRLHIHLSNMILQLLYIEREREIEMIVSSPSLKPLQNLVTKSKQPSSCFFRDPPSQTMVPTPPTSVGVEHITLKKIAKLHGTGRYDCGSKPGYLG